MAFENFSISSGPNWGLSFFCEDRTLWHAVSIVMGEVIAADFFAKRDTELPAVKIVRKFAPIIGDHLLKPLVLIRKMRAVQNRQPPVILTIKRPMRFVNLRGESTEIPPGIYPAVRASNPLKEGDYAIHILGSGWFSSEGNLRDLEEGGWLSIAEPLRRTINHSPSLIRIDPVRGTEKGIFDEEISIAQISFRLQRIPSAGPNDWIALTCRSDDDDLMASLFGLKLIACYDGGFMEESSSPLCLEDHFGYADGCRVEGDQTIDLQLEPLQAEGNAA